MENLQNVFSEINWLAVLVAVIANQFIGAMWYGKAMFGAQWAELVGLKMEDIDKGEAGKAIMKSVLIAIVGAVFLAVLIYNTDSVNPLDGLLYGGMVAFFSALHSITNNLFEQRPSKLVWINVCYPLVGYSVMGLIIGAWA